MSLNDINESKYPIHSNPLSDADTLAHRYCDVVDVDYKEYLLRGDQAVYMAFINCIAEAARQKDW